MTSKLERYALRPWHAAGVVFIAAALCAALLVSHLEQQRLGVERAQAGELAADHAEVLEIQIERTLSLASVLAALIRQSQGRIPDFEAATRELLPFYPGVAYIHLAPDGVVAEVVPRAGNEAVIGLDLLRDPARAHEASLARDSGQLTLAGPHTLRLGGMGVVGRMPVFLEDGQGGRRFWGFVSVALRLPETFGDVGLEPLAKRGFVYKLWRHRPDRGAAQVIIESSAAPLTAPVHRTLRVPNGTWALSLSPIAGWADPIGLTVKATLGLIFSLLLALLASLLVLARAQGKRLAAQVAERTAEIRAREADLERAEAVSHVGSWVYDIPADFCTASAEGCRINQQPPGTTFSYRTFMDMVHPDDRERLHQAWQAALRGHPYDIEHRTLVDGRIRWMRQRAELEFDPDGRPLRAVGTMEDVTDRRALHEALRSREAWLRQIVETAAEGIWAVDPDGRTTFANPRIAEMLGCRPEELVGRSCWDFMDPEARRLGMRKLAERRTRDQDRYELRFRRVDGAELWTEVSTRALRDTDGRFIGVLAMVSDIAARRQAEAELRIAAIAFESQESMFVTDAEERILRVNRAFTRSTGYTAAEAIGQTPRLIGSGHHDAAFFAAMWERIRSQGFWEGEIWNRRKSGEVFPEWMTITAVCDEHRRVTNYVATLTDITQRKAAENEIRQLAFHDPLTGLPNRRLLLDRLHQSLAASMRNRQAGALLFIDLDHFKALNDTLGHAVGDLLLKQVAERLSACQRENDSVARLGGDEFVVMLQDLADDPEQAATMAKAIGQRILAALGDPYCLAGHEHRSTPSIGIALFGARTQATPQTADAVLRQADLAMYQAKAAGRNTLYFSTKGSRRP